MIQTDSILMYITHEHLKIKSSFVDVEERKMQEQTESDKVGTHRHESECASGTNGSLIRQQLLAPKMQELQTKSKDRQHANSCFLFISSFRAFGTQVSVMYREYEERITHPDNNVRTVAAYTSASAARLIFACGRLISARAQTSHALLISLLNFPHSTPRTVVHSMLATMILFLVACYLHSWFLIIALANCLLYSLYSGRSQSKRSQPNLLTEILGHQRPSIFYPMPKI